MESIVEVPPKKPKSKDVDLPLSECVRQFELPCQYPSTITKLRIVKPSEKNVSLGQTKSVQNIISALPLSSKMKFVPNKDLLMSESLQKVKLKLPNGRDLVELKLVQSPTDNKLQSSKFVKTPKIGIKSDIPVSWAVNKVQSTPAQTQKPRIKTIKTIITNSSSPESQKIDLEQNNLSKMKVQILNDKHNVVSTALTKNNGQSLLTNLKKPLNISPSESTKQRYVLCSPDGDVQKFVIEKSNMIIEKQKVPTPPKVITLNKAPSSKQVVMLQKDNKIITTLSDKVVSLKPVTQSILNNHKLTKNVENIVFRSPLNGSVIKKRSSSVMDNVSKESKKICLDKDSENLRSSKSNDAESMKDELKINTSEVTSTAKPKQNIMVIVPHDSEVTSNSKGNSNDTNNVQQVSNDVDLGKIINVNEIDFDNNDVTDTIAPHTDQTDQTDQTEKVLMQEEPTLITSKPTNEKKDKPEKKFDKFSILEKAVLSVPDATLRAEALKALKDCGIKVKKRVPIVRSAPTKIIKESDTQTEVFSLLEKEQFVHVSEQSEVLTRINQVHKVLNVSLSNRLSKRPLNNKLDKDHKEFKNNLDNFLEHNFPDNEGIANVKEALSMNQRLQAKAILKQLQLDFKATKEYNEHGLLGIHQAVLNNDLREVQKHKLLLNATKTSIDVPSQDNKTSLELAVEFEVNPQIIHVLLEAGAQPVSSKPIHDSAIIIAAKKSLQVLPLLFKYVQRNMRSLLNIKDENGLAAIHYCAQYGNYVGIKELIRCGADVNLQDDTSGRTALFYAVETKVKDVPQETYNEIALLLLENGAISNIPIFSKHTILSFLDDIKSHTLKIALNKAVQ